MPNVEHWQVRAVVKAHALTSASCSMSQPCTTMYAWVHVAVAPGKGHATASCAASIFEGTCKRIDPSSAQCMSTSAGPPLIRLRAHANVSCAPPPTHTLQTSYVRYKTQPEAYVSATGWELATSRKFAEKLAQEEGAFTEDTLLYNGLAPVRVNLRIIDAPAEYAVPVKQDRCVQIAVVEGQAQWSRCTGAAMSERADPRARHVPG